MTHRLIYGKTIVLKGDDISFNSTNDVDIPNITSEHITVDDLLVLNDVIMSGTGASLTTDVITCTTINADIGNIDDVNAETMGVTATGSVIFPREFDNPTVGPLVINGGGTGQGSQAYTTFTVGSTGARVAASAATCNAWKLGHTVFIELKPGSLATGAGAAATDTILLAGLIPVNYRPPIEMWIPIALTVNNLPALGVAQIDNFNGNVTIYATVAQDNFVITQVCAMQQCSFHFTK